MWLSFYFAYDPRYRIITAHNGNSNNNNNNNNNNSCKKYDTVIIRELGKCPTRQNLLITKLRASKQKKSNMDPPQK
jgi:hypothetical protein